ncbi:MAG: hypothetical protein ABEI11_01000 [Haloarculaceae archaeon]
MSRDDATEGEFRWVSRTARPPATGDDPGPTGNGDGDGTGAGSGGREGTAPRDDSPRATEMTTGMRAVWTVCWVGSAVGLGLASARLVGVSAALLGPRALDGLLAGAAWSGALGSALFAFGMVACYWVVKRDRRGLGALLVYLTAVTVAGLGVLDSPAGYLALAVPIAGMAELVYNGRRGYFDAPTVTPAERVEAALDERGEGTDDGGTPGRHPRTTADEPRSRHRR